MRDCLPAQGNFKLAKSVKLYELFLLGINICFVYLQPTANSTIMIQSPDPFGWKLIP